MDSNDFTLPPGGDDDTTGPLAPKLEATNLPEENKFSLVNLIVLVGMKGSTKTTNLVRLGLKAQVEWKRPVFSDFPYSAVIHGHKFEPEPMPDDIFITYGKDLPRNAVILTDEMQEFFDRQNWMTVQSRMGVSVFQQIRKLGFLIIGATQYLSYLNTRINEQIDILVRCRDMRLTPWGISEGIDRGKEALLQYYDLCGGFDYRGSARNKRNPHFITGLPFFEELVFTQPFWEFFNSRRLTAIEHKFKRYQIEKEVIPVRSELSKKNNDNAEAKKAILALAGELRAKGVSLIQAGDFNQMLLENDEEMNIRKQGALVKELGIPRLEKRGRYYYNLEAEPG